jgi:NCAIR mutase (PurE)-related protein
MNEFKEKLMKDKREQKRFLQVISHYLQGKTKEEIVKELKIHRQKVNRFISIYEEDPSILKKISPDLQSIQIFMMQKLLDIVNSPDTPPKQKAKIILDFFKLSGLKSFKLMPEKKMKVVLWKDEDVTEKQEDK